MVLDAKVMEWATQHGLDTAVLKKAKIPVYGKWYFPDLPADTPLVNMRTGQVETFPSGYRAGAILYVIEEDLKRAGLGPYRVVAPPPAAPSEPTGVVASAPPAVVASAPVAAATSAPIRTTPASPVVHAPSAEASVVPTRPAAAVSHASSGPPDTGRGPEHGAHAVEHAHPTSGKYVQIAVVLAVITAIEVALYYIPNFSPTLLFWALIGLSAIKFTMVAAYFMHLKFDHVSFTGYFGGGLALAISIFLGLLALQYGTHGAPSGF